MTEGESIKSIKCSADCEPSCYFEWIYPNGTKRVGNILPQHILQKKHNGQYKCKASNGIANNEKRMTVTVNYAPENIRLSPAGNEFVANELSNFNNVTCLADCLPSCEYRWIGQTSSSWSTTNRRLQINSIRRTAAGSYKCSVRNTIGTDDSSNINIIVYTRPTQVDKITVVCTSATTASIAWIPDMTVVPGENFTVKYKTNSGRMNYFPFEGSSNKDDIYLLQVDNLAPSTKYTFTMESKNGLGQTESNKYTCTTTAASEDSEVSGALIGGIVLISIALLLIIIVIALIALRKFRILTTDLSSSPCGCPSCITTCIQRVSRLSNKGESPYMNTKQTHYVNTTINGPQEGNVNMEVTNDDNESEKHYDELVRRPSNSDKPYDSLQMSPTGTQNDPSSHYANYENVKKNKKKKEKVALKPPPVKQKPKKKSNS
ncbi:synaptogenesis protein syg-2-like isoform X2 [Mytilus californianus]|nr:synaptogenesis protein syg-2-like isoform X2 [Mytilus californianus]